MNEEQELRDRLRAVDVPASRIEIDALVRAGRRRTFRRRSFQGAGGVALATAVLLAVPSIVTRAGAQPGAAPATGLPAEATASARPTVTADGSRPAGGLTGRCPVVELPVPSGMKDVTAVGVDPAGRYIIGYDVVGQDFRPVLWTDGKPQALPVPGTSVELSAVNADGVVVGVVQDARQEYVFRYRNGVYTRLRTPQGNWHVYPEPAINATGDVVINAEPQGNSGGKDSIALFWKAGSTTAVKLPLPDGANVFGITDDGTIVGTMYRNGIGIAAYAWDRQGNGRKLKAPDGETAAGYAVRGGWATGGLWPSHSAARWNLRTGEVTQLAADGPGEAVNAAGWVVVNGSVLRDGDAAELEVPDGQTSLARAVSDTGMVVGQARAGGRTGENLGPRAWRC
ncbi:hypothetical protein ACL02O_21880 [Micromonospora sp. MS34]|uniref:hypothetical protein n=1 Tax=Micromonospora sp. MS34 TaxID=3385971 RepID=UPI00399FEE5B